MSSAPVKPANSFSPSKRVDAHKNNKTSEQVSKFVQNYIAAPVCGFSALSGITSFLLPNYFNTENALVEKSAFYSAKAAILTNAIFGMYDNGVSKNTPGIAGYFSDFVTTFLASEENMYTLRGVGSALDQIPGFLEVLAKNKHPAVIKKFGNNFAKYSSFSDSLEKTVFGIKTICSDLTKDFKTAQKEKGIFAALLTPFESAAKNLLISSVGILSGVGISFIPGMFTPGAKIRDVFGLQADFAVIHKGFTDKRKSSLFYILSGIFYTIGTLADFIYRWTEKQNLNLFAIGSDRFGAFLMALGNATDNRESRNGNLILNKEKKYSRSNAEPQYAMAQ